MEIHIQTAEARLQLTRDRLLLSWAPPPTVLEAPGYAQETPSAVLEASLPVPAKVTSCPGVPRGRPGRAFGRPGSTSTLSWMPLLLSRQRSRHVLEAPPLNLDVACLVPATVTVVL